MIGIPQEEPLYPSATFSQEAEEKMIELLLDEDFLKDVPLQRRLSSYIRADEIEKSRLISEIMEILWKESGYSNLFRSFRDFDQVISVTLGRKSHFIHQFEVFVLGWTLIKLIERYCKKQSSFFKFVDRHKIFTTWLVTAMLHDFGYPLQMARPVMERFSDLYDQLGIDRLSSQYKSLAEKHHIKDEIGGPIGLKRKRRLFLKKSVETTLNLDAHEAQELLNKIGNINHGYASASLLYNVSRQSVPRESPCSEARLFWGEDIVNLASASMVLHALPDDIERYAQHISFERNPYCYLLYLVDNLQEWSRNFRPDEEWPSYSLLTIQFNDSENILYISYMLKHMKWTEAMRIRLEKSLREKKSKIAILQPLSIPINFKISIEFKTNHGELIDKIFVAL